MEKLINYLKRFGKVKELYQNHEKSIIELNTKTNVFLVYKYISPKSKIKYGLSKLINEDGILLGLEAKVLKDQDSLKREIEKIVEPLENKVSYNKYDNTVEHVV